MLTDEQKKAIKVIAKMVKKTGAYDYVDHTVEIRLYDEELKMFNDGIDEAQED